MVINAITKIFVGLLFIFIVLVLMAGILKTDTASLVELLNNDEFIAAVWFSLKTSLLATVLAFLVGVPAGFYLARTKSYFVVIIDAVFDIPMIVPPLVVGVFLLIFFNVPIIKNIYSFIFTLYGAVIAQFFVAVPLTIKSAKSAFELIPDTYEMVAMTLGSRPFKAFYNTTFKIAFPGILSGLILTWLRCMGEFGATLMVGGGIPLKTENIPINIYLNMSGGDFKLGVAASIFAISIALVCIIFLKLIYFLAKRRKI